MGKGHCFLAGLLFLTTLEAITPDQYQEIMIGSSITEVAQTIGPPFSVKVIGQRAYEYTYVDRYTLGGEFLYENRYILTVVNGQVVDKRVESVESPPYDELYQMDPNYPSYP